MSSLLNLQIPCFTKQTFLITGRAGNSFSSKPVSFSDYRSSKFQTCQISPQTQSTTAPNEAERSEGSTDSSPPMNHLLFVEMGVGYDQHGQDITAAATRACRDAITSNSIPAFRRGIHLYS
jgi:hypothetical protein